MKKLPQYLAECPQHRWNSKTQLFDAHLFQRQEDGSIVFTESYAITPCVFNQIIKDMIAAQQEYFRQREAPSNVVKLSRD
jgi:hypothetical protein